MLLEQLKLTTPVNPFNGSHRTHSIRHTNGPANRYDYILPCGLLTNPPAPLLTNDSYTASDHLPVFMKFGNPYIAAAGPFSLTSIQATGSTVTLNWESVSNKVYGVEASTNLFAWTTLASNLTATGTTTAFITNSIPSQCYFRVFRLP